MAPFYDFGAFLTSMSKLDLPEIIVRANDACRRAEGASFGKAGPRHRALGSNKYVHRIKEFLFFLQHGRRPGSATKDHFAIYRPVVEALVAKGQLRPALTGRWPAARRPRPSVAITCGRAWSPSRVSSSAGISATRGPPRSLPTRSAPRAPWPCLSLASDSARIVFAGAPIRTRRRCSGSGAAW
jgi:hypothetical protein